ncbi:MAG: hypothetical protein V3V46_00975, partial [Anaerolineales bacterium]
RTPVRPSGANGGLRLPRRVEDPRNPTPLRFGDAKRNAGPSQAPSRVARGTNTGKTIRCERRSARTNGWMNTGVTIRCERRSARDERRDEHRSDHPVRTAAFGFAKL